MIDIKVDYQDNKIIIARLLTASAYGSEDNDADTETAFSSLGRLHRKHKTLRAKF